MCWHTCVEQPGCVVGVQAQLGGVKLGLGGAAFEESSVGEAVIHKALADAAIAGHAVADLGQHTGKPTLLHHMIHQ